MRLLALAGDADALIAQIRLRAPLEVLSRQRAWPLAMRSFHDCTRADLAGADVLIVQRGMDRRAWRLQDAARRRGGAVVYEIDDLLTQPPPHLSNQAAVLAQGPWLRRCLATADVVTVSTPRLGQELGLPHALCVPNCAWRSPGSDDAALPPQVQGAPVSLLFASMEPLATGALVYPALRALQGTGAQIVAVGPAARGFVDAGLAVQAHPLMPRADFLALARSLPNPVAVIPLEASPFAACKSAIKWFEYAEAGLPVLCSAVSPYTDVVEHGRTGWLVAGEPGAWAAALQQVMGDADGRRRIAEAARQQVRLHHTLQQMVDGWQQAIERAVQQRASARPIPSTLAWRLREALDASLESAVLALRRFHRARLKRRQRR